MKRTKRRMRKARTVPLWVSVAVAVVGALLGWRVGYHVEKARTNALLERVASSLSRYAGRMAWGDDSYNLWHSLGERSPSYRLREWPFPTPTPTYEPTPPPPEPCPTYPPAEAWQ